MDRSPVQSQSAPAPLSFPLFSVAAAVGLPGLLLCGLLAAGRATAAGEAMLLAAAACQLFLVPLLARSGAAALAVFLAQLPLIALGASLSGHGGWRLLSGLLLLAPLVLLVGLFLQLPAGRAPAGRRLFLVLAALLSLGGPLVIFLAGLFFGRAPLPPELVSPLAALASLPAAPPDSWGPYLTGQLALVTVLIGCLAASRRGDRKRP